MKILDDTELRNKKIGDTVYYRCEQYKKETMVNITDGLLFVEKIDKDYIYARATKDKKSFAYNVEYEFNINGAYEVQDDYTKRGCIYSSKEFYEKNIEFDTKCNSIIDCIKTMHTESDMRLVDAMYELMNNWEE